ncbi:MAG: sugar ABC transporter substrate-binding protein [Bacilli bacterium]|nr:sugar ABC transporter substrate-binding protein [Bacilli bacterium]MDD4076924.1 sugar ABC transporter substrate-binding protein [Bacilli bacterium]MDD4388760.1 sugar ABC transporter substrate-binding protein [Bacilli bacterium]
MFRVLTAKQITAWMASIAIVVLCMLIALFPHHESSDYDLLLYHWDNGGSTETNLVKEVCNEFTKVTGIKVKVEIISSYETQFSNFIAAKRVPDVFLVPDGNFGQWVSTGVMLDLTDYVATSTVIDLNSIWPSAINRYRYNGKTMGNGNIYCLPKDITPYVMYYNKDLFDKYQVPYPDRSTPWAPEEATYYWRQFGIDSPFGSTVTAKGKLKDNHIYGLAKFYPESLIWSNGADYLSADRTEVLIDTPEFIEVFAYLQKSIMEDYVAPPYSLFASTSEKSLFLNQKAACYIEGRSVTADLRRTATFDWDIAPIPAYDTEYQNINGWSGSVGYAVYKNSEKKDEAYQLVEFFTSKHGQMIMTESGFSIPLYNDEETIKKLYEVEAGKRPKNTPEYLRAAQYQKAGLWQYLPSIRWKTKFDTDSGVLYSSDPSLRPTAEQFLQDEKNIVLNIIKTDFPELFNNEIKNTATNPLIYDGILRFSLAAITDNKKRRGRIA